MRITKTLCMLLVLSFAPIFCMENSPRYTSPVDLIHNHVIDPNFIHDEIKKYPLQHVVLFRDNQHSNLLHYLVDSLMTHKDSVENFNHLVKEYEPIFYFLVAQGLDINEVNDDHQTPILRAYKEIKIVKFKQDEIDPQSLIDFLESDLGALPSYVSLAPELRACKKFLWNAITCQWYKQKYN